MKLLDFAIQTTNKYIDEMPKSQRKKYGQFFTSKETAVGSSEAHIAINLVNKDAVYFSTQ